MPEGPEVKTITEYLHRHLAGQTLLFIQWDNNSKYIPALQTNWELYVQHSPYKIESVCCHGKRIFFHLQSLRDDTPLYIHSHLGMTGSWLLKSDHHSHLWLDVGQALLLPRYYLSIINKTVYFDEQRPLGKFEILTAEEVQQIRAKLGPDVLSGQITYTIWYKIISKHPQMNITAFLMNQHYVAGIGNYLKSEILYRARISPHRKIKSLSIEEHNLLYDVSLATIKSSYEKGGLTIKDYKDPEGRVGQFEVFVYGKKGQKDSHGYTIIMEKTPDGRSTYWVPEWQK